MSEPRTVEIDRIDDGFNRWDELLALILAAFAYMNGIIDPPSSAHRLTVASLQQKAREEIPFAAWEDGRLVGCVFCKPEPDSFYIGKLAVAPSHQNRQIGRRLMAAAEAVARERGLPALRLETRIELTDNQQTFCRWGFVKTAENAHPGFDRTTSIEMQKRLT